MIPLVDRLSDVIVVYTYAAVCILNLVYAQPLQKTVAKFRVLLTLNSSDIAVICASSDVNKMNSCLSRNKHRGERTEIILVLIFLSKTEIGDYSQRERNRHQYVSVLRSSTHRLARLTKFDDSSQMQYIDQCVCLYLIIQE